MSTQPEAGWVSVRRDVLQRCVTGIEHLSALARLWEPDHSSGSDRRGWVLANDARDDAKEALAAAPHQAAPAAQPLTESQIWNSDAIMAANADAALDFRVLLLVVRAVEAAHDITP